MLPRIVVNNQRIYPIYALPQELGMLEYELLTFRPSHLASAAVLLAKLYTNESQGVK